MTEAMLTVYPGKGRSLTDDELNEMTGDLRIKSTVAYSYV